MSRFRFVSAWMLLVAFLCGGVMGPVLHGGTHVAKHEHVDAHACHIDAAHNADRPVAVSDANASSLLDCVFCSTRHTGASDVHAVLPRPLVMAATWTAPAPSLVSTSRLDVPVIRGPPVIG